MRSAPAGSVTLSPLGTALPPAAAISSQTFCAGVALPRALAVDRAAQIVDHDLGAFLAAASSAISRPMPPPAPVTSTTLSFSMFAMAVSSSRNPAQDVPRSPVRRKA